MHNEIILFSFYHFNIFIIFFLDLTELDNNTKVATE